MFNFESQLHLAIITKVKRTTCAIKHAKAIDDTYNLPDLGVIVGLKGVDVIKTNLEKLS